jgi:hypothetical protein
MSMTLDRAGMDNKAYHQNILCARILVAAMLAAGRMQGIDAPCLFSLGGDQSIPVCR